MPSRPISGKRPFSGKPSIQRTEVWSTTSPCHVPAAKPNSWISGADPLVLKQKVYLPVLKTTRRQQQQTSSNIFERLYPDATEKSRCQQLLRRWESLPGLRKQLNPEELDALAEQVRSLSPSHERQTSHTGLKVKTEDVSPQKDFPFIPCTCCERESPIARMKREAGLATKDAAFCHYSGETSQASEILLADS